MSGTEQTTMDPSAFDRVWRGSGVAFVVTFVVSWLIYGSQPEHRRFCRHARRRSTTAIARES